MWCGATYIIITYIMQHEGVCARVRLIVHIHTRAAALGKKEKNDNIMHTQHPMGNVQIKSLPGLETLQESCHCEDSRRQCFEGNLSLKNSRLDPPVTHCLFDLDENHHLAQSRPMLCHPRRRTVKSIPSNLEQKN